MNKASILLSAVFALLSTSLLCQTIAILDTGDTIVLYEKNIWNYKITLMEPPPPQESVQFKSDVEQISIQPKNRDQTKNQIGESSYSVYINKKDWKAKKDIQPGIEGVTFKSKGDESSVYVGYQKSNNLDNNIINLMRETIIEGIFKEFKINATDKYNVNGYLGDHQNIVGTRFQKEYIIDLTTFQMRTGLLIVLSICPRKSYEKFEPKYLNLMGGLEIQ